MNRIKVYSSLSFMVILSLILAASVYAEEYANSHLLVETDWLGDHLNDAGIRIIDARSEKAFQEEHIPNALLFDRATVYDTVGGIRGMLPSVDKVKDAFEGIGISNGSRVVIYDDIGGLWASRIFWALEYLGHKDVSLLNGGWKKWKSEGRQVTAEVASVSRGRFTVEVHPERLVSKEEILNNLDSSQLTVLDARSIKEYTGEDKRADRGGHVPDAINVDWVLSVTSDDLRTFLPADELLEMFEQEGLTQDKEIATHCQTGVRAAHSYFTLRLLGYEKVKIYDGSWIEWGNDPDTPIVSSSAKS